MEEQVMTENKQQLMYQWIKGDRFGDVVTVAEDQKDGQWLYFADGTRIAPQFVQEYLMEVKNDKEVLKVAETVVPQTGPIQNEDNTIATNSSDATILQPKKELSAIGQMIAKLSKKNVVNVPLQININIPTAEIYAMLTDSMEEQDLNDEIMEVALKQIEIDNLKEFLKENLNQFLSEYYS